MTLYSWSAPANTSTGTPSASAIASGYVVQYGAGSSTSSPGFTHRLERLVDGLLAAVGDDDLGCVDLEPRVAQRLRGDRLAQHRETDGGRVAVVRRVVQRLGCGIHDELRRGEVGLARRVA